ncbi:RNA-binding protein 25-like [Linepithema humile]|uniref:RNA-binding protein 25-like n=1 Tax=Linepithema humile TaxID=83485 RepID=UPI00351F400F
MAAKNNMSLGVKQADVEMEIAKGEQDDLLEDYPKSKRERIQKLRSKALVSKIMKHGVPRSTVESVSTNQRIKDLARPTKQRALITLRERASILPPTFVDNLIRIIEAESCLTPEEAAQVRRKKRRTKIKTRLPRTEKWMRKISEDIEDTTMDRDAAMCQYLIAKRFVKSILEYQCFTPRKDIREIADVIMRRLISYEAYADTRNDDRATQQLRLLADVVACWIAEILVEVASTRKYSLEEYCRKRKMKMETEMDVDNEVNSKIQDWKQIELKKERQEKRENKNKFQTEEKSKTAEKENKNENEEQKRENTEGEEKQNRSENEEQKRENTEGEEKENRSENEEQKRENTESEEKKNRSENEEQKRENTEDEGKKNRSENESKNEEQKRENMEDALMKKEEEDSR